MKTTKVFLLLLVLIILGGCSVLSPTLEKPVVMDPTKEAAILAYAQPKAENLTKALFGGTYADFSKDLTDQMKAAMPETAYADMTAQFKEKLGNYQSSSLSSVLQQDKYAILIYKLVFDTGKEMAMRVVVDSAEPHQVSGLWFDAPGLR